MMELVKLRTPSGLVLWAHLSGQWSGAAFDRLGARIAGMALPAGSQVVLDFSAIDHLDYRTVPRLLRLAAGIAGRRAVLHVVGFSPYLRRIIDFGGALDGREFLERHAPSTAPSPPAPDAAARVRRDPGFPRRAPARPGPRPLRGAAGSAPVDAWVHSLASAARRAGVPGLPGPDPRSVALQPFARLLEPHVN